MNAIRRRQKEENVRIHNEKYAAEKARWDSMTREEQIRELVRKGVDSAIKQVRKDWEAFNQPPKGADK